MPSTFGLPMRQHLIRLLSCSTGIRATPEIGRYRYVPLFAVWLRTRLHAADEQLPAAINANISRWAEANGMLAEAVHHALRTPDFERATALLLGDIATTLKCPSDSLLNLLALFPMKEIVARPSLALLYAYLLVNDNRLSAAQSLIDQTEASMSDNLPYTFTPTGENLRGYFATIRSRVALLRYDLERGRSLMMESASLLQGPGMLYNHYNAIARPGYWAGDNQGYGIIQTILGESYYMRGQFAEAERFLLRGRSIGLDLLDTGIVIPASLTLIQLRITTGETEAAFAILEETRLQVAAYATDQAVWICHDSSRASMFGACSRGVGVRGATRPICRVDESAILSGGDQSAAGAAVSCRRRRGGGHSQAGTIAGDGKSARLGAALSGGMGPSGSSNPCIDQTFASFLHLRRSRHTRFLPQAGRS
ncbi:hypothetical protein [Cohnella fermenti]|uniref:hypothetical protein n=1 Tax=Cohnella fermenti TaxID=2565925 RepID=UPI001E46F7EE|nr:hypothetical protein [Cohnella fermenti]